MRKFILSILTTFIYLNGFGQYSNSNYRVLGDKAFKNKDFYEAAYYYKKSAQGLNIITQTNVPFLPNSNNHQKQGKPADVNYIRYQLAESYRLYENYLEAEPWYYQVVNENIETQYPLVRLWYGICLRADQHFDEAIKQLTHFELNYKGDDKQIELARKEIKNCRFAKEQEKYPSMLEVAKLKGHWNSDGSNYAVIRRDANFFFTSSRLIKSEKKHHNRIYNATAATAKPEIIDLHDSGSEKEIEYGTPSLSPLGNRMYFTRWYKTGSKTVHAIYKSELINNEWTTPKKLNSNVNAEGFNALQPFVMADGKKMLFVSNKPGGQGGDDIWLTSLDSKGDPINSTNLGAVINTPMDEQAPFYDQVNKKMIYSSKGFTGLGGFDFFETDGEPGMWSEPRNMGSPLNSAKDDLYYTPDAEDDRKFYISSDRESDCCLELFQVNNPRHFVDGYLVDCDTHKPLAGATVTMVDSVNKQIMGKVTLAKEGRYSFKITTQRPYNLVFEKTGYFTKVLPVSKQAKTVEDTLYNQQVCLQRFEIGKPVLIANILYDYNKATLRPESEKVLDAVVAMLNDNPKFKIELSAHTDSIGSEAYNQKLSQDRAQSCVTYIISKGVSDERIFAKGYGELKPVASNSLPNGKDNPNGRQLNRRTEFTVLKAD